MNVLKVMLILSGHVSICFCGHIVRDLRRFRPSSQCCGRGWFDPHSVSRKMISCPLVLRKESVTELLPYQGACRWRRRKTEAEAMADKTICSIQHPWGFPRNH